MSDRFRYSAEERAAILRQLPYPPEDPGAMFAELEAFSAEVRSWPKFPWRSLLDQRAAQWSKARDQARALRTTLTAMGAHENELAKRLCELEWTMERGLEAIAKARLRRGSNNQDQARDELMMIGLGWWLECGGHLRPGRPDGPLARFLVAIALPVLGAKRMGRGTDGGGAVARAFVRRTIAEMHLPAEMWRS